jgi:hypothetical protein
MSKNKKGPFNNGQLSPEKYVRTQARTLPVEACLITEEWQNSGICNIIIARKHKTGNLTIGLYLVDTYCLGLKDTSYQFNISAHELNYFKGNRSMIKCDYVLAHNIIYGGIAFAEDYGFNPHKDFAVTRFILEEDDEGVELMDIDFGLEGLPCYMRGPYDDDIKARSIEATLAHNAGPGNYTVIAPPGDFAFDEDGEQDENDFLDEEDNPFLIVLKKVSEDYDQFLRPPEVREMLSNSRIGMDYELSGNPIETEYVRYDGEEERKEYVGLYEMVFESTDMGRVIEKLKKALLKYPDKPLFYNLAHTAYTIDSQWDKADEIVYETYRRFPGYLFSKIAYSNLLMDKNRLDEVLAVFDGNRDLNALYPGRKVFHKTEASAFFGTLCRYFITVDNVDAADQYMNAILKYGLINLPGQTAVEGAIIGLAKLKMDKLEEAGKLNTE